MTFSQKPNSLGLYKSNVYTSLKKFNSLGFNKRPRLPMNETNFPILAKVMNFSLSKY